MREVLDIVIVSMISGMVGAFLGFSAIYVFNKMPAKWLCDYGEEPAPELLDRNVKRIKEYPLKLILPFAFAIAGIYLCSQDYVFGFAALIELWILFMIALSDAKYMIIPDQFVIFLALFSVPLSVYRESVKDMVLGALAGAGIMIVISLVGKVFMKKSVLGFGDVKLMGAIGLTAGLFGTAIILVLTSLTSAAYFALGMVRGSIKRGEEKPLGPFIALSTAFFLLGTAALL